MVRRNHKRLYQESNDPWSIGDAVNARYDLYLDLLGEGDSALDMGCGTGAFTTRLRYKRKFGFDISRRAIEIASERYRDCAFTVGKITNPPYGGKFDAIICSDAIYYVRRQSKVIRWISEHLNDEGKALIAAYAPGGRYPTPEGLNKLVSKHMEVIFQDTFYTGHTVILARKRRTFGAFTVDYENWMPVPGDSEKEVTRPAEEFASLGIPITYFVNMAEPVDEDQLRSLAERGHDLQLHYHFGWPEPYLKAEDYQGSVIELIRDEAERLEEISGKPVTCFRAGGYQVQPFTRLFWALRLNGIHADSSVWKGGVSSERGYNFSEAPDCHYYTDISDAAKRSRRVGVIEIPILTKRGKRWNEADLWQPKPGYNVLISHTKGPHNWERLRKVLSKRRVEWISMSEMVRRVRDDFAREQRRLREAERLLSIFEPYGLCAENCIRLAKTYRGLGYNVRHITLYAEWMPNGRGPRKVDTHEVLSLIFGGFEYIFDPTYKIIHPHSLEELLDLRGENRPEMYAGYLFFSSIIKYAYRNQYKGRPRWMTLTNKGNLTRIS